MADHDIINPALYRAIFHGVAAGACQQAAQVDTANAGKWCAEAEAQRGAVRRALHQAASWMASAREASSTAKSAEACVSRR